MRVPMMVTVAAMLTGPGLLHPQLDFNVDGRSMQVHSFATQGFAYSNQNNFLTMKTSQGTFAMTDFSINITTQLTDRLRVGAQVYDRNIGQLGGWRPLLDYAYVDYHFKDWLGIRAGRVKTQLGLYTSTQDADFLRTWALLPQSMYPADLRAQTIAHDGGDLYGVIPMRKAGTLSYTLYAGAQPNDRLSGMYFQYEDTGKTNIVISASMAGADLRWNTPVKGLLVGISEIFRKDHDSADQLAGTPENTTGKTISAKAIYAPYYTSAPYADYAIGPLHFSSEYRRNIRTAEVLGLFPFPYRRNLDETAWFVSGSYRLNKWLEIGAYHSRYYIDHPFQNPLGGPPPAPSANHIFDQVGTVRLDLTRFWNVKLEGHFMDGTGDPYSPHGFYARVNPAGALPATNMVVVRTGWNF